MDDETEVGSTSPEDFADEQTETSEPADETLKYDQSQGTDGFEETNIAEPNQDFLFEPTNPETAWDAGLENPLPERPNTYFSYQPEEEPVVEPETPADSGFGYTGTSSTPEYDPFNLTDSTVEKEPVADAEEAYEPAVTDTLAVSDFVEMTSVDDAEIADIVQERQNMEVVPLAEVAEQFGVNLDELTEVTPLTEEPSENASERLPEPAEEFLTAPEGDYEPEPYEHAVDPYTDSDTPQEEDVMEEEHEESATDSPLPTVVGFAGLKFQDSTTEPSHSVSTLSPPPVPVFSSIVPAASAAVPVEPVKRKKRGLKGLPVVEVVGTRAEKTYWGLTAIAVSFVVFLAFQVIASVGLIFYLLATVPLEELQSLDLTAFLVSVPLVIILSQLSMYIVWVGSAWWVTQFRSGVKQGKKFWAAWRDNFWFRFKVRDIFIGLGVAALMMGFQLGILNLLPVIFPGLNEDEIGNTGLFETLDGVWFYVIALGIGGIIGPFLEELFFRGFLMRGLVNHFSYSNTTRSIDVLEEEMTKKSSVLGSMVTAYRAFMYKHRWAISIIITSVAFGLMHFQGAESWEQLITPLFTGFLGFILGFMVYKIRRIWPSIFAHIFYNTTSFVLLLFALG